MDSNSDSDDFPFTSGSFFPYSLNEIGKPVLLMRNKKDSKCPDVYASFGAKLRDQDPSILFSIARAYIAKTCGLCVQSEIENLNHMAEVEKRIKEFKEVELFSNRKVKAVLKEIVASKFHVILEAIGQHLVIFYPLPYFRLDTINKVFSESDKWTDTSFHWIPLSQVEAPENKNLFTAFDRVLIGRAMGGLKERVSTSDLGRFIQSDYQVVLCDDSDFTQVYTEALLLGQLIRGREKWFFYKAFMFEFPSKEEIKKGKGIVVSAKAGTKDNGLGWLDHIKKLIRWVFEEQPALKIILADSAKEVAAEALGLDLMGLRELEILGRVTNYEDLHLGSFNSTNIEL